MSSAPSLLPLSWESRPSLTPLPPPRTRYASGQPPPARMRLRPPARWLRSSCLCSIRRPARHPSHQSRYVATVADVRVAAA
eukprot:4611989-Prymnesium_polylepis.1